MWVSLARPLGPSPFEWGFDPHMHLAWKALCVRVRWSRLFFFYLILLVIKAYHSSLSKYEYDFFRSFHISLWKNFFRTWVVHVSLTKCTQWLLNLEGGPLVPKCTEFVFKEGWSILRTIFVTPQPINFSYYSSRYLFVCFGLVLYFHTLKLTIYKGQIIHTHNWLVYYY